MAIIRVTDNHEVQMTIIRVTGILQLSLSEAALKRVTELQKVLPPEARPRADKDLHITLWKLDKANRLAVKEAAAQMVLLGPEAMPVGSIFRIERPERDSTDASGAIIRIPARTAWITLVDVQDKLRQLVAAIADRADVELPFYERSRPFHISIANLTGSPFDSVGDVEWEDLKWKDERTSTKLEKLPSGASGPMAALETDTPAFGPPKEEKV